MAEVLGIGCVHGPGVTGPLERIADTYLRFNLKSPLTPEHMKDPKNWPKRMQEEWGDDEGLTYAKQYQETLQTGHRAARAALDAFNPEVVVMFGDDQYENFKEDCLLPFCIFAIDEVEGPIRAGGNGEVLRVRGHREAGNLIAKELIRAGFDVGTSWKLPQEENYGHAFSGGIRHLDLDHEGFDFRMVPITVNCYGSDLRIPQLNAIRGRRLEWVPYAPPPSPQPWRCFDLGREVRKILEASPYRAAVIASSAWSHASLTPKHYFLWPDVEADRQRFEELAAGEHRKWRDLDLEQMRDSGEHEMLNWVCLAGAMEDRKPEILAYAEAHIFNSDKCVALFRP